MLSFQFWQTWGIFIEIPLAYAKMEKHGTRESVLLKVCFELKKKKNGSCKILLMIKSTVFPKPEHYSRSVPWNPPLTDGVVSPSLNAVTILSLMATGSRDVCAVGAGEAFPRVAGYSPPWKNKFHPSAPAPLTFSKQHIEEEILVMLKLLVLEAWPPLLVLFPW